MNNWSLTRWEDWIEQYPDAIDVRYHDSDALDSDFRCHNTVLHLAVLGHWAAEMRVAPSEFVDLLLSRRANPNAQNDDGKTPLHLACEYDTLSAANVKLLLESGADPGIRDQRGETPLDKLFGFREETQRIREMLVRAMKETS